MLEILLVVAAVVAMGKIAAADDRSAMLWGAITLLTCFASVVIPLPFVRVVIACVVVFIAMIVAKAIADRPTYAGARGAPRKRRHQI